MDRYQSIRRTITGRSDQDEIPGTSGSFTTTMRRTQADIEHHSNPGITFLARSDFPVVVRSNQVYNKFYNYSIILCMTIIE